jgi:hypothetical protein
MPRPERPLDPLAGPIQAFATELRKLRTGAGNPKYLQMARRTGRSRTALAEAAGGDHLPTWETVEAFVTACGADPASWRARWEAVDEQLQPQRAGRRPPAGPAISRPPAGPAISKQPARPAVSKQPARPAVSTPPMPRDGRAQRGLAALVGVLAALAVLAGSAAGAVFLTRIGAIGPPPTGPQPTRPAPAGRIVEIHSPDGGMVYQSTKPQGQCAERGCDVPGSALMPGAYLEVACYMNGDPMIDGTPHEIGEGPDAKAFRSYVWYGAIQPNRLLAFLPQVYLTPRYRDDLGLPECSQLPGVKAN